MYKRKYIKIIAFIAIAILLPSISFSAYAKINVATCYTNDGGYMMPSGYSSWYKVLSYYANDSQMTVMWLIARDRYYQCTVDSSHIVTDNYYEIISIPASSLGQYGL